MIRMIYFKRWSDRNALGRLSKQEGSVARRLSVSFLNALIVNFEKSCVLRGTVMEGELFLKAHRKMQNVFYDYEMIMRKVRVCNILLTSSCIPWPSCKKKSLQYVIDGSLVVCLFVWERNHFFFFNCEIQYHTQGHKDGYAFTAEENSFSFSL